ncbi:restriction endonuclease, partial [Limimaricola cinnabarinus]|uniref:restriction endonuclease n=1 Tax=Limimaricola cinnabarinus TaxID=1125964 RepID=UPI002FE3CE4E
YFTVTKARFAILTNGRVFEFYSDIDEPNKLDERPFLKVDLLDVPGSIMVELKKFEKSSYDEDSILSSAARLKYVSEIKGYLTREMENPSDAIIKLIASEVHDGRMNAAVREMLHSATKHAFRDIVREAIQSKLSSALVDEAEPQRTPSKQEMDSEIETTEEEIEGMLSIRAAVRGVIDTKRVTMRDAKSYCAILIDDNNRKPLARLHFNRKQKYIGLFDGEAEERVQISDLDDILHLADRLQSTAKKYVEEAA